MRRNVFLFLMFALVFSCTKFGKNVTIKGRVFNPITGAGIPNVEVELLKTTAGLPGGNKGIKSTYTDANGNFDISKGGLGSYWLACRVSGDYYEIGWVEDGINVTSSTGNLNVKKGKTMHVDFHAVPYGEMKYTIKNVDCFNENDTLFVKRTYQLPNVFYKENLNISIYNGCFQFIGQVYSKYPMGWHYMEGYYKKNNVITNFKDSIYISSGGQHEWIFEY